MDKLDVQFLDTYKRFEKILSDMFCCEHGVSQYISLMEENERNYYSICLKVYCWKEDYKKLKHLRWIRNQITHNVDCIDGFCNYNDLEMLNDFYDRILCQEDALALFAKYQRLLQDNIKVHNNTNKLYIQDNDTNNFDKPVKQDDGFGATIFVASVLIISIIILIVCLLV